MHKNAKLLQTKQLKLQSQTHIFRQSMLDVTYETTRIVMRLKS